MVLERLTAQSAMVTQQHYRFYLKFLLFYIHYKFSRKSEGCFVISPLRPWSCKQTPLWQPCKSYKDYKPYVLVVTSLGGNSIINSFNRCFRTNHHTTMTEAHEPSEACGWGEIVQPPDENTQGWSHMKKIHRYIQKVRRWLETANRFLQRADHDWVNGLL